jgi:hypothetical protein
MTPRSRIRRASDLGGDVSVHWSIADSSITVPLRTPMGFCRSSWGMIGSAASALAESSRWLYRALGMAWDGPARPQCVAFDWFLRHTVPRSRLLQWCLLPHVGLLAKDAWVRALSKPGPYALMRVEGVVSSPKAYPCPGTTVLCRHLVLVFDPQSVSVGLFCGHLLPRHCCRAL